MSVPCPVNLICLPSLFPHARLLKHLDFVPSTLPSYCLALTKHSSQARLFTSKYLCYSSISYFFCLVGYLLFPYISFWDKMFCSDAHWDGLVLEGGRYRFWLFFLPHFSFWVGKELIFVTFSFSCASASIQSTKRSVQAQIFGESDFFLAFS